MKRLLAVALAVAMVGGAVVLRDRIDEGADEGSGPGSGEPFRLTCATELSSVCDELRRDDEQLRVTVEDPGTTSDRLVELDPAADPGFDAWLVDGPWAAITEDNRQFADRAGSVLGRPSDVLGRSPAVVVLGDGALDQLPEECEPRASWGCLGGAPAGVRVGVASPERGDGLVVLAGAAADALDSTAYAANDFDQPGFTGWFDRITRLGSDAPLGRQSPLEAAIVRQGQFNVVGALEAQSSRLLRDRPGWTTTYPLPVVTADVTLVPPAGADGDDVVERWGADRIGDALSLSGWRVGGSVPDGGDRDVELPEDAGLPAPGVLQRLRELW